MHWIQPQVWIWMHSQRIRNSYPKYPQRSQRQRHHPYPPHPPDHFHYLFRRHHPPHPRCHYHHLKKVDTGKKDEIHCHHPILFHYLIDPFHKFWKEEVVLVVVVVFVQVLTIIWNNHHLIRFEFPDVPRLQNIPWDCCIDWQNNGWMMYSFISESGCYSFQHTELGLFMT